jgi:uncharacterized membrane protein YjjP (DUF1212 family)
VLPIFVSIAVLAVAAVLLISLRSRAVRDIAVSARAARITGSLPVSSADAPDAAAALAAAEAVGSAMIQAGYSVETVQDVLGDIARVNGLPESEVLVFPNALLVSARGQGQHQTGAVASGDGQLLFSQIDEVQHTVDAARTGLLDPRSTVEKIARIRDMKPIYGRVMRVVGYAFLSAALSVLLGASWAGVSLAAALGLVTGTALLISERLPRRYGALITVAIAFSVALVVFLLLRNGAGSGILAALLAPLVVLLPGALLTTAALELSTGQMISGAGRLAAGGMQLVLLGAGIVTAGALVGVPDFDFSEHPELLGPIAPWIAVAVYGVAISVHRCAPARSIPWILLVLYVAYSAQVLGDLLLGGVFSAFIGALVVTPVTALVARQPTGPAALVSFTPAFWLLVPGALGLVGVADVLGGDSAAGASLVATLATMVAIALGVLAGSSLSNRMRRPAL